MAIALDTTSSTDSGANWSSGTSASVSHTCTGTNMILIAALSRTIDEAATSVTYNSVAMTSIARKFQNNRNIEMFYLINPSPGANTLAASWTTSGPYRLEGASYSGAQQSGQPDSSNTGGKASATGSDSLNVATSVLSANCWLVGGFVGDGGGGGAPFSVHTGTTLRNNQGTAFHSEWGLDSNGTVGTGSQSLQIDKANDAISYSMAMVVASIAPATAVATVPLKALLGVGQ